MARIAMVFVFALVALAVAPLAAATPALSLGVPAAPQPGRGMIAIPVRISGAENLGAWEFDLEFDPSLVRVVGLEAGPFFGVEFDCSAPASRCVVTLGPVDAARGARGRSALGAVSYGSAPGASGSGVIATIYLEPTGKGGTTHLRLVDALLTDTAGAPRTPAVSNATLTIEAFHALYLPLVRR